MNITKFALIASIALFASSNILANTSQDTNTETEWCKQYEVKEELKEGLICDSGVKNEEKLVELIDYLSDEAFSNMKTEMNLYIDQKLKRIDQKLKRKIELSQDEMQKIQLVE